MGLGWSCSVSPDITYLCFRSFLVLKRRAAIAQSVLRLATGSTTGGSNFESQKGNVVDKWRSLSRYSSLAD
jgi:hypothetical protein